MPGPLKLPDLDDLIARYESGTPLSIVAKQRGVSFNALARVFRLRSVRIRDRSESLCGRMPKTRPGRCVRRSDWPELIARYQAGASLKQIADETGVSRPALMRKFAREGVTLRTQHDAELLKWRELRKDRSAVERQLSAAWDRVRGRVRSDAEVRLGAQSRQRRGTSIIWLHEQEIADALRADGLSVVQQVADGRYNIDIAHHETGLAVEIISSQMGKARRAMYRKRLEYLCDRGWFVLIVSMREWRSGFDYAAIRDQIVAFAKIAGPTKALRGQYGMISRYGQPITRTRDYLPCRPCIFRTDAA